MFIRETYSEQFEIPTTVALVRTGTVTSSTLLVARYTRLGNSVGKIVHWAFVFALFASFETSALGADVLVETETRARFAAWVTFPAHGFSCQRFQRLLRLLGIDPVEIVSCKDAKKVVYNFENSVKKFTKSLGTIWACSVFG